MSRRASCGAVDFPDNSECLDLIEGRHKGVFALLDEQCGLIKQLVVSRSHQSYTNFATSTQDFEQNVENESAFCDPTLREM